MQIKLSRKNLIISVLCAVTADILLILFHCLRYLDDSIFVSSHSIISYLSAAFQVESGNTLFLIYAIIGFVAFCVIAIFYISNQQRINSQIFRYRYFIAAIFLFFSVIFEISGSSIGMWANNLPSGSNDGLLLGKPRECRTDEWALFTGMAFAQRYDPKGPWPLFGSILRGTPTDMFMVYGQPVLNPVIIFRPFQIGYLFLGLGKGLAFYWNSRLISLFLASFELGRIITNDKRGLSVCYAVLVTLSPVVSWWCSINCLVEMLFFFSLIIISTVKYIDRCEDLNRKRYAMLAMLGYSLVCFALTLYPAWEIPMAYLLLAIITGYAITKKDKFLKALRLDKLQIAIMLAFILISLIIVALQSKNAILAEIGTDYPGHRINTGGGAFSLLFRYPISVFLPFVPSNALSGLASGLPDNVTSFFDLFPLGLVLFFLNSHRESKIDWISISLCIFIFFIGIYCCIGIPESIAKVTLLGKSIPERAFVIFAFANLILLIRELSIIDKFPQLDNNTAVIGASIFAIAVAYICVKNDDMFFTQVKIASIICIIFIFAYCAIRTKISEFIVLGLFISVISGAMVNPIQIGINVIESNPLIEKIRDVASDDPNAKWIAAVDWKSNIALYAGVPTINTTNIYPNKNLWAILDPNNKQKADWNRYAHIHAQIIDDQEQPKIELTQIDVLNISVNYTQLKQLDISYVLSNENLTVTADGINHFSQIAQIGDYSIYKVLS